MEIVNGTCSFCGMGSKEKKCVRLRFSKGNKPHKVLACKAHIAQVIYPSWGGWGEDFCVKADQPMIGPGRTVGVEVEGNWGPDDAVRLNLNPLNSIKGDGSLRGADAIEVVSPIMTSETIRQWYLDLHVENMRTYNRTGEHWWFGTKDLGPLDINKLLYYCAYHQSEFVRFMPQSRTPAAGYDHSGRPMAIGWKPRLFSSKDGFVESLYGMSADQMIVDWNDGTGTKKVPKYRTSKRANDKEVTYPGPIHRAWWLNVHSYFFTGGDAIEVRIKNSSRNPLAGIAWLDFWLAILETVPFMTKEALDCVTPMDIAPAHAIGFMLDNETDGDSDSYYGRSKSDVSKLIGDSEIGKAL